MTTPEEPFSIEDQPEAASEGRGSRWKKRALVAGALGLAALVAVVVAVGLKANGDSHDRDQDDDGIDDEELDTCQDCGKEECVCHLMCWGCGEIVCECDEDDDDTTCPHCDGIEGMRYCPECHRVDADA